MRYKTRLVAQKFFQRIGIDYDETHSPMMDTIMFRFLVSFVVLENWEICLIDVEMT